MLTVYYSYPDNKNEYITPSVIALGLFDGMHLAHRELILKAKEEARARSLSLTVFTFSSDGDIKSEKKKIYSDGDKLEILRELGVDRAVLCDFPSVKELSPEDFVNNVLINSFGLEYAVFGFNFRFGKGASGDSERLLALLHEKGLGALMMPEMKYGDLSLSSTVIREMLERGDVEEAALALGAPYFLKGITEHGRGVGRGLGIPTVNTSIPKSRLTLGRGVYLTETEINGKDYPALTNVGTCPTFDERPIHAETYILGFKGDLYGKELKIKFLSKIRDEKQFKNEKDLVLQINIDKNTALSLYEKKRSE